MRFDAIRRFWLLGGGSTLAGFAEALRRRGSEVLLLTSPRHADERLDGERGTLADFAGRHGFEMLVTTDINADDAIRRRIETNTLAVSFGADWIFAPAFIARWDGRLLNLHGTRLPHDRGGGGFSWRILRGDRLGCSLLHVVAPGVDDGPILLHREFVFPPGCRVPADFYQVADEENLRLLDELVRRLDAREAFEVVHQPEYLSLYWPRLSTEHQAFIDWTWTLSEIEAFICAFDDPYRGASTFWRRRRIFLKKPFADASDGRFHPFQTGIVFRRTPAGLFVATREGALVIREVVGEDGTSLVEQIRIGDRLHTPIEHLDSARLGRPIVSATGLKWTR